MFNKILLSGFLVLILSLGFMQPFVPVGSFRLPLTDFIFPFVCGFWLVGLWLKKTAFRSGRFYLPLLLYFSALFLSTVFSRNPGISFGKLAGEMYLIGLAVLTFHLADTVGIHKKIIFAWLASLAAVGLTGLLSVFFFYFDSSFFLLDYTLSHYGSLPAGNYPRLQTTFFNSNMLCNYLTAGFILLLTAYELGWIKKTSFVLYLSGLGLTAALTFSPGIGGILLGIGLWLGLAFRQSGHTRLALISAGGGVFFAGLFLLAATFSPFPPPAARFFIDLPFINMTLYPSPRLLTWIDSFQTFIAHPVFGIGPGLGPAAVQYVAPSGQRQMLTDAHQMWLNIAGQAGIFGLISICFLCFRMVRQALPLKFDGTDQTVLRTGYLVIFISAFLYQGLTGSFENARHLWVLIGLLAAVSGKNEGETAPVT